MSIAVGVSCAVGAVVAADSQRIFFRNGVFEPRVVNDKLLRSDRFVAAHRGASPVAWGPLPALPSDFAEAADRVWRLVSNSTFVAAGERDPTHELVIAGGPIGQPVQMALISTYADSRFAPPCGGVLVAGASEDWEPPNGDGWWPPPQPRTMVDCVTTALQLCTEIIRGNLARLYDQGDIPSACWPVRLALVTPRAVTTYVMHETHRQCQW